MNLNFATIIPYAVQSASRRLVIILGQPEDCCRAGARAFL